MQKLLADSWSRFYACMWRAYYAETEGLFHVHIPLVDDGIGNIISFGSVISIELQDGSPLHIQRSNLPKYLRSGRADMKSKVPLVRALAYMNVQLFNEREKWASYSQRGFTLGQSASVRQEQLFSVLKSKVRGGWPKNATLCACVKMVIERLRKNKLRTFLRILRSEPSGRE